MSSISAAVPPCLRSRNLRSGRCHSRNQSARLCGAPCVANDRTPSYGHSTGLHYMTGQNPDWPPTRDVRNQGSSDVRSASGCICARGGDLLDRVPAALREQTAHGASRKGLLRLPAERVTSVSSPTPGSLRSRLHRSVLSPSDRSSGSPWSAGLHADHPACGDSKGNFF